MPYIQKQNLLTEKHQSIVVQNVKEQQMVLLVTECQNITLKAITTESKTCNKVETFIFQGILNIYALHISDTHILSSMNVN
jgi:hypothetical protein